MLPSPLRARAEELGGFARPQKRRKPQVKSWFCKPICKPDAAGQAGTAEMQKAADDFTL